MRGKYTISIRELKRILFYSLLMFAFIKPDSLEYIGLKWLDIILILVDGITMFSMILLLFSKKYRISSKSIRFNWDA